MGARHRRRQLLPQRVLLCAVACLAAEPHRSHSEHGPTPPELRLPLRGHRVVDFKLVNDSNAVPGGPNMTTEKTAAGCEALCRSQPTCLQWTWNTRSHHCFRSASTSWSPIYSDHTTSGCRTDQVSGCGAQPQRPLLPRWNTTRPSAAKRLAGYEPLTVAFRSNVHRGEPGQGSYNHNVFIDFQVDTGFVLLWKNGPRDEDSNGQRILYSRSADGRSWQPAAELFPSLPNATQEPGPFVHLGSRLFAACSPGVYNMSHNGKVTDQDAQGSQFCLWPDPVDPRNCGPPDQRGVWGAQVGKHTLMMREVLPNKKLGEIFWASGDGEGPERYRSVNAALGAEMITSVLCDFLMQNDRLLLVRGAPDRT